MTVTDISVRFSPNRVLKHSKPEEKLENFHYGAYHRGCSSDIASSFIFRSSKVVEHVTSRVSGSEFRVK